MKKFVTIILATLMAFSVVACGGKSTDDENNNNSVVTPIDDDENKNNSDAKEVDMTAQELLDAIKEALGDSYTSNEAETEDRVSGFYGLDLSKIESWAGDTRTDSAIELDTSLVLKVQDGYAEEAAALIQTAFEQIASYSQMYNMDAFRVAEARIFISGNYVGYFIEGTPGDWEDTEENQAKMAAEEAQKIDVAWTEIFGEAKNIAVIPEASEEPNLFE